MIRVQPHHRHSPWLIYIILPLLLVLFGLQVGILVSSQSKISSSPLVPIITPTPF